MRAGSRRQLDRPTRAARTSRRVRLGLKRWRIASTAASPPMKHGRYLYACTGGAHGAWAQPGRAHEPARARVAHRRPAQRRLQHRPGNDARPGDGIRPAPLRPTRGSHVGGSHVGCASVASCPHESGEKGNAWGAGAVRSPRRARARALRALRTVRRLCASSRGAAESWRRACALQGSPARRDCGSWLGEGRGGCGWAHEHKATSSGTRCAGRSLVRSCAHPSPTPCAPARAMANGQSPTGASPAKVCALDPAHQLDILVRQLKGRALKANIATGRVGDEEAKVDVHYVTVRV